ncbi:MAG: leucine-rich repeat protein [Tidjanibacter sp.]|nr:leucine-rich repeat protein [Tidjanibacter sp.]
MKKLLTIFATFVMLCAVGCEEQGGGEQPEDPIPDDAYISTNKEVLTFSPDGESIDVIVYSNYEWTLTNNCDWVTTSISGGEASEGGTTITLSADLTYDNREGTIIFSCGKARKVLVVSQSFNEAIIADENNTFSVPAEGGNVILDYQTTVECEVIIPEEAQGWISLASGQTRGLVSGSATLNIAMNNKGVERSAVVKVVKDGDHGGPYAEYTITQERNMDYVILYTTTDGNTVSPNSFYYLANTYDDGVGMLAFDGSNVTSIGRDAFYECTSLTSITIPDSVTSIGKSAFYGCTSLTSVTIGNSVTSIGERVFAGCTSLTSVTIGNGVTSIGDRAFADCTSLTSIDIPDSVTSIGVQAFYECTSLTSVTIPDSVTSIGWGAFYFCSSLTSVTIPDSVTSIGEGAFCECTSLASVYCKPTTPPTGRSYMFDNNASGRKIYVPRASVYAYWFASYWRNYASAIEGYDF